MGIPKKSCTLRELESLVRWFTEGFGSMKFLGSRQHTLQTCCFRESGNPVDEIRTQNQDDETDTSFQAAQVLEALQHSLVR